ncbi:Dirigent protein 21 [Striga hermonthica]|uniref:Dirigent protein n=1 Tax=Striga hermonthica TaxID=68872 RepID=A0A9N7MTY5_STRHE|nr:Dirigent protein 21 [Striga hermonthica]
MDKSFFTFLTLCAVVLSALPVSNGVGPVGAHDYPKSVQKWYKKIANANKKVTQLHFYLHDLVGRPSPTNVPIAAANSTARSSTLFGLIGAMDDLLTVGPSPDSEIVGRAQGLLLAASLEEIAYHMTFSVVFTNRKFNGSTLSLVGHNPFLHENRELAIVGGSGFFRLARGTAVLKTLTYNSTSGDAIVEYNIIVLHY